MRVLVTGAGGGIGGEMCASFAKDGAQVTGLYRSRKPDIAGIDLVQADLADGVPDLGRFDLILHAAGQTCLMAGSTTADFTRSNVDGALQLARFAEETGAGRLVYLSTFSVYGTVRESVLTEETPLNAPDPYGASKYFGELIFREMSDKTGIPTVTVRLPGVVWPGYFEPWLGRVLKACLEGRDVEIFNADAPFNNVIDTDNIYRFFKMVCADTQGGYTMVNIGAACPRPLRDVVAWIKDAVGSTSRIIERPEARPCFVIDTDTAQRRFAFEADATQDIVTAYAKAVPES